MAGDLDKINKWRIEQFKRNNKEDKSPEKDFVCLSPKTFQDDPDSMFLSDSEEEKNSIALEADGLVVVSAIGGRKKRKRSNIVYTAVSDGSEDDIVVNRPRTRQSTMKVSNSIKSLPLKPLSVTKKTAVVMPITKVSPHVDDAELGIMKVDQTSKTSVQDSVHKSVSQSQQNSCSATEKLADSDSDLSLFEVSFNKDSTNNVLRNPPPSPIDITNGSVCEPTELQRSPSPNSFVVNSIDNYFSSDDSNDSVKKRKGGKGKQPANKRRKVVTKTSRPLANKVEEEPLKKAVDSPATVGEDIIVLDQGDKNQIGIQKGNAALVYPISVDKPNRSAESSPNKSEDNDKLSPQKGNRAVVKPNSPPIIIEDDDDDDVVMLTNSEKNKQELDDLQYARRLQAHFDEEQTRTNGAYGPLPDPRYAQSDGANASATRRVTFADSPLPERSERLLQAVGASPALTQLLGSPRSSQTQASLTELTDVEQRLQLLRQLALQNEYIDDAVITEILGVPAPPPDSSGNRGPRPPSLRPPRHERVGTAAEGAADYQQAYNTFQRALLGLGMDDVEDASYESLLELADRIGDARQAGLEPQVIDQLPCRTYKEAEATGGDSECLICMSDFKKGQRLRTLHCFHEYHSACIDKWLQRNASCPICRVKVTFD